MAAQASCKAEAAAHDNTRADLAEAGSNLEQIFLRVTGHDLPTGEPSQAPDA